MHDDVQTQTLNLLWLFLFLGPFRRLAIDFQGWHFMPPQTDTQFIVSAAGEGHGSLSLESIMS